MKKLAIVTTHPIQYNAPWFKLLNTNGQVTIKVFYTWGQLKSNQKFDPGFDKAVEWDIPLLEGYDFTFVTNISTDSGSHHRKGIINPSLNNEIEEWRPDAILIFGWNFDSHLRCMKYFHKKIPIFFRGDSTLLDEKFGIKSLIRRLFLKWVYTHIDFAFFVGTNNKKYFIKHGLKDTQLIYAPHAIDNDRFSEPNNVYTKQANDLKNKLGIKADDVVLLFAGKLEQKKNPFFLIELLKKNINPRLKILFVGHGKLELALKDAASNDKRINFIDFKNQLYMPVIYRVANILILPSTGPGETWGLSLNEAMACGKAIAASDKTGGAIDLIHEGENGILFNLTDTSKLDYLIEKSLLDNNLLIEMGKESKKIINAFNFSFIVVQIEILINSFS